MVLNDLENTKLPSYNEFPAKRVSAYNDTWEINPNSDVASWTFDCCSSNPSTDSLAKTETRGNKLCELRTTVKIRLDHTDPTQYKKTTKMFIL